MDWIRVDDKLPGDTSGIYKVKLENEQVVRAYYYEDRIGWAAFYGQKTGHWWRHDDKSLLDNVTYWMPNAEN